MSWHTTALILHADFSKDISGLLAQLGLDATDTGEAITFEEAASSLNEGVAVGATEGWTALWGDMALLMVDEKAIIKLAKHADVFQMILEGASDTAGFAWYCGGKKVREWIRQEGDIVKESGKPLPQEKAAFEGRDDEQAMLALMESLTLPYEKFEAIKYQAFDIAEDEMFGEEE